MKKNLSKATVISKVIVVIPKETVIPMGTVIPTKPKEETALGREYRKQLEVIHGEEHATKLLYTDTTMSVIQEKFNRIYTDESIIDKKTEIREFIKPVVIQINACEISKKAELYGKLPNFEFDEICNVGVEVVAKLVDRLPIRVNPDTNEMCLWTIGKKKDDSTIIESLKAYTKDFVVGGLIDYFNKHVNEGLTKGQVKIDMKIQEVKQNNSNGEKDLYLYVASQMNRDVKEVIEVTEIIQRKSAVSLNNLMVNSNGDNRTVQDTVENKSSRFIDEVIAKLDGDYEEDKGLKIARTIANTIHGEAERKALNKSLNVNSVIELNVALYNLRVIEKNKKRKAIFTDYMTELIPNFKEIISRYGTSYESIVSAYKLYVDKNGITQQALSKQAIRLEEDVKEKVALMYVNK